MVQYVPFIIAQMTGLAALNADAELTHFTPFENAAPLAHALVAAGRSDADCFPGCMLCLVPVSYAWDGILLATGATFWRSRLT